MSPSERRLRELLDAVLCDSQTDVEAAELERLLDESPEARSAAIEQLRVHSLLQWELAPATAAGAPAPAISRFRRVVRPLCGLGVAAAATLFLAVWMGNSPGESIGRIFPGADLRLASATSAVRGGNELTAGSLRIDSGTLRIEFASGVEMDLAGPAECDIVSGMLVRMSHGKATAQAPRWARGFTIETSEVGVVNQGTRFGVSKDLIGKTEVVVFDGELDVRSLPEATTPFERRLTQGEAARIDREGSMERIFQVHGEWHAGEWSTARHSSAESVISAVWDNLGASKSVSYYQVLPHGLVDDCPAYVDHPHQWNGVDRSGLPEFLRNADYVRTVNDYRYRGELVVQIELARAANLYVLFDERTPLPDWLRTGYQDTGATVGLDEDAWDGNPGFSVDSGAGVSIDNRFTVWRRDCEAGEVVVLGSMGVGREARAMYGVAATPR